MFRNIELGEGCATVGRSNRWTDLHSYFVEEGAD